MSEGYAPVLVEGARLLASVTKEKNRYDYLSSTQGNKRAELKAFNEETIPGLELNNFITRVQTEGETHVLVTEHKEYLEKIAVPLPPPTAEEIAQEREDRRFVAQLIAGVASVGIVVGGVLVGIDRWKR